MQLLVMKLYLSWMDHRGTIKYGSRQGYHFYKVMSFRLKNAGATYQCAIQRIFNDISIRMLSVILMIWY